MATKEAEFLAYLKETAYLKEAAHLLEWDSVTGMPKAAASERGAVYGYLSGKAFERDVSPVIADYLTYFTMHLDELTEVGRAVYEKVKEKYRLNCNISVERFAAYTQTISESDAAWRQAREEKDFSIFRPYLEKIVAYKKEFIPLWRKNEPTAYDVLLNQYEIGMTAETLDRLFAEVKAGILQIRQTLTKHGKVPAANFLTRTVPVEYQKKFVTNLISQLGFDFKRGRLDETIHPFMLDLNQQDIRLTTRWEPNNLKMAIFGVMHEAGHGSYAQNILPEFAYTPLNEGASMGMHESQSLFNEIIIGSNWAFWQKHYPELQSATQGIFSDISVDTFYRGLFLSQPSFIRIDADPLTYPLHIIIRYEIEKDIINGEMDLADLPEIWNTKYEEYLGIRPANDLEGILQDVHWSQGDIGYFPSYVLGYMYATQMYATMNRKFSVSEVLRSDDLSPIQNWLKQHIQQYGASRMPGRLIQDATGEMLQARYLLDFLQSLYYDVYQIDASGS